MKIAEKLIFFRKGNYNLSENSSIIVLIDNLTKKLQQLILEGANKDEILNYLKL